MKNGYYMSAYLAAHPLSYLEKTPIRHDENLALWYVEGNEVQLIKYWELERITGFKQHTLSFFSKSDMEAFVNGLLKSYDLTLDDLVEVWGTPELEKEPVKYLTEMQKDSGIHTVAHLYSGLLSDTELFHKSNIVALAVDGGPDGYISNRYVDMPFLGAVSNQGILRGMKAISSPGILWELAKSDLGLREGTLMALASASKSVYFMDNLPDYSFSRLQKILDVQKLYHRLKKEVFSVHEADAGTRFNVFDPAFTQQENKTSMLMKIIQEISERTMVANIQSLLETYPVDPSESYLSITGGYALNCPTNSKLMKEFGFRGFTSPPCVSDCGISYGIGLMMFYLRNPNFHFKLQNAFYGETSCFDQKVQTEFNQYIESIAPLDESIFVQDLEEGPVGWLDGEAEIGPRALGHRSILGDPRQERTKELLNQIKQREWWRPVAPIILEEKVGEWFEEAYASPYMLHTFRIRQEKAELVPAILHLDQSARVQTLNRESNERLYRLISAFYRSSGVPMICNTSLNDRGEPIVNTASECLHFCISKQLNTVYINGLRIRLKNQSDYPRKGLYPRNTQYFDQFDGEERRRLVAQYNPVGLDANLLKYYFEFYCIFKDIDLRNPKDVRRFYRLLALLDMEKTNRAGE